MRKKNKINLGIIFVWCCLVLIFEDWSYEDLSILEKTNSSSSFSSNKYSGQYSGNWEGYLLNQYNTGSASFYISDDGSAKLSLRGKFSAVHNGYISGDYFVINSNNEKCRIVDMDDGSFKVVLIWTGVNVDVFFP